MLFNFFRSAAVVLALLAFPTAIGHAASIQGHIVDCGGKLCPWFQATADAPKGWEADEKEGERHRVAIYFPEGANDPAKGDISGKTAHDWEKQPLEDFISGAQKEWLKENPTSTVERLEDLKREGKPTVQLYLYRNPSQPKQAFELTAFVKDKDDAHPAADYFFQAVLSAPSMQAIDDARPAFMDLLKRL